MDGVDCDIAGDGFCDTPPDYLNFRWNCNGDGFSSTVQTDPNGVEFQSDGTLFMSYSNDACMNRFSDEQIEAMRANLLTEKADHLATELPDEPFNVSAINIVSPEEGEQLDINENITFEWEPVPNATAYFLEITLFSPTNSALFSYLVEGTSFVVESLPKNRTIYWRLRPFNDSYTCGETGATASFETGETLVSSVASVEGINAVHLQPNPVRAASNLLVSIETNEMLDAEVAIVNLAGQSQLVGNQSFAIGENKFEVSTENLSPGMYFLQLRSAQGLLSQKFVVW
jgi:hypothetical protein